MTVPDSPAYATHEVLNQAGALEDYNAFADDKALTDAVRIFAASWRRTICKPPVRWSAARTSSTLHGRPTGIYRNFAPMIVSATASTS